MKNDGKPPEVHSDLTRSMSNHSEMAKVMNSPPSGNDPSYLEYLSIMELSSYGAPLDYTIMNKKDCRRKQKLELLKEMKIPKEIYRKTKEGFIVECWIHKLKVIRAVMRF